MTKPERKWMFDEDKLVEAIARGWCAPETENNEMDVELVQAIHKSVSPLIQSEILRNVKEFADRVRPTFTGNTMEGDECRDFVNENIDAALKEYGIEP